MGALATEPRISQFEGPSNKLLPATAEISQYELKQEGIATRLVLLDTVGYGHEGPRADKLRATENAARQSDLIRPLD